MDIEEFYDEDPRRRASPEVELGSNWRDRHQVRYELSWVADTGELYVMREPVPSGWADPFGGVHARGVREVDESEVEGMTVAVVGVIGSREELERLLSGWEQAMEGADGVGWLADRLRQAGVLVTSGPGSSITSPAPPATA